MNELKLFQFEDNQVRTVSSNGIIWFAAVDVTNALGIKNPSDAIKPLDEDERARFNLGRQAIPISQLKNQPPN